jgi:hypothetical protein
MVSKRSHAKLADPLGTLYSLGTIGSLSDDQLLERFLARNERAEAEAAFAALVDRHGAMVLSVCQRVLRDSHEAHDKAPTRAEICPDSAERFSSRPWTGARS